MQCRSLTDAVVRQQSQDAVLLAYLQAALAVAQLKTQGDQQQQQHHHLVAQLKLFFRCHRLWRHGQGGDGIAPPADVVLALEREAHAQSPWLLLDADLPHGCATRLLRSRHQPEHKNKRTHTHARVADSAMDRFIRSQTSHFRR